MKKQLLAIVIGTALTLPMAAHAQRVYVGASAGQSEQKFSFDNAGSSSEKETSFKVFGGYEFNPNVGVELGAVNFGKIDFTYLGANVRLKPTAAYAAVTGTFPVTPDFSIYGKVGVASSDTDGSLSNSAGSIETSDSKTTGMFGVGAAYHFNKNVSVLVEYENYGKVIDSDGASLKVSTISAGIRYNF